MHVDSAVLLQGQHIRVTFDAILSHSFYFLSYRNNKKQSVLRLEAMVEVQTACSFGFAY